jgi:hypothetical protein
VKCCNCNNSLDFVTVLKGVGVCGTCKVEQSIAKKYTLTLSVVVVFIFLFVPIYMVENYFLCCCRGSIPNNFKN